MCLPLRRMCPNGRSMRPAVEPHSFESSVPALRLLRRCLLPTQTVCRFCPTICAWHLHGILLPICSAPTFGSFGSAVIGALSRTILRSIGKNVCFALEDTFSLTFIQEDFLARKGFPPRHRTAVTKRGGAAPGLCGRSYACHCVDHPSCPDDRCSGGRRLLHSRWSLPDISAASPFALRPSRPANQRAGKAANTKKPALTAAHKR